MESTYEYIEFVRVEEKPKTIDMANTALLLETKQLPAKAGRFACD